MKIVPISYLIENEDDYEPTETAVIIAPCVMCGRYFAVPAVELNDNEDVCCVECEEDFVNMITAINAESESNNEAKSVIDAALGD
jgi:hypothetical protein